MGLTGSWTVTSPIEPNGGPVERDQTVVTAVEAGRVAQQQGQAVVTPEPEFRVANMFVEVFVELREGPPPFDDFQGGAIRRGIDVGRLGGKRRR